MARGRPRKPGKRTKGGYLKREATPFDRGSEWVQAMKARFGEHYSTALGRAFASGLLGEGVEANDRYQAGKRFVRLHRIVYGGTGYRCPLNDAPRGNVSDFYSGIHEHDRQWLDAAIDSMDVAGVRPYLDQLTGTQYTDQGPYWLENLLAVPVWNADYQRWNREELPAINMDRAFLGKDPLPPRQPKVQDSRDLIVLNAAIQALDIMAPERRSANIVATNS